MIKFKLSGRLFGIDPDVKPTLLDLAAIREVGIDPDQASRVLADVVAGHRKPDTEAVLAIGLLAYLSATRDGSNESWREFARSIDPSTLEVVEDEPAPTTPPTTPVAASEDELTERILARLAERKAAA